MTDKLKIEKNIPITRQRHKRNTYADLLNKMEVGDSIKADFITIESLRAVSRKIGVKCTTRKLFDKDNMHRIWRTE
jgi:predicted transcriptional regulator